MTTRDSKSCVSKVACAAICIASLHGCSVNGKWTLSEVEPTAAIRDIEYSPQWRRH